MRKLIGAYLHQFGFAGVRADVHHVDPAGPQAKEDEAVTLLRGVMAAAGASVPTHVMELIANIGHLQTVDYLHMKGLLHRASPDGGLPAHERITT